MTYVVTYVAYLYQIEVPVSVPDRLAEGMRELETILDKREVVLCAPLLLIYAHKRCKTIGRLGICEFYRVLVLVGIRESSLVQYLVQYLTEVKTS